MHGLLREREREGIERETGGIERGRRRDRKIEKER